MYSQGDIEDAIAAGALAPEQAASLRAHVAARNNTPTADEEYWWLVRGFNDYFVFYASLVLLIGIGWLGVRLSMGSATGLGGTPSLPLLAGIFVAAASWGLAEVFTLRRRMALPSFLFALGFGLGVYFTILGILAPVIQGPATVAMVGALCGAVAAAATFGFWLRFRVPFAPALGVGFAAGAISAIFGSLLGGAQNGQVVLDIISLMIGAAVFAYAMWWDMKDPWRVTERSDVALWLHVVAAVMIVIPLAGLLGLRGGVTSTTTAVLMVVMFLVLAVVALAVNRKALLLASAVPLIVSIANLFQRAGYNRSPYDSDGIGQGFGGAYGGSPYGNPMMAPPRSGGAASIDALFITLLLVSLLMLVLAIFWAPLRRTVVGILPAGLRDRMPAVDPVHFHTTRPPPGS